ncbi:toprim domain-containing protein [Thermobifida cellulosilytica]|uniref:Topoisomerase n=1 Tax=Thermobifida cellulosilytica TB100 TaxID=665004 RepID=A0A147KGL3_THECS|nr:topoisomerase [Thermobifida cellulosilytica]KUP96422.1 topoisomerase [Thermobifida cellulosilytica TB100]
MKSVRRHSLANARTAAYQAALTPGVARYLLDRGIGRDEAITYRLGVVGDRPFPGHERFRGMLAIPYLDRNGKPLTIRFRCLEEHDHRASFHGKYNTIKDDPPRMYGIDSVHQAGDTIDVAEGELDRIILRRIGLHAVAIPGAALWQGRHRRMLAGFNRVRVWGDPDDAGAEFTARICRALRSAKGVRLRDGDVTETYLQGGEQALLDLIKEDNQ